MFKRWPAGILSFERDERHSSSVLFISMILSLLLAAGAALDYARVANMRDVIDTAVQSASEAGAKALQDGTLGDEAVKTVVLSHFDKKAAVARHVGTIDPPAIRVDRATASVRVDATGVVAMTVGRLIGMDEVAVPATSAVNSADVR